jgi:hypothetical protein
MQPHYITRFLQRYREILGVKKVDPVETQVILLELKALFEAGKTDEAFRLAKRYVPELTLTQEPAGWIITNNADPDFKPISVKSVMNRIDELTSGRKKVDVVIKAPAFINNLDDNGRIAAAKMIVNGSATARSIFLDAEYKSVPMADIMEQIDRRERLKTVK